MILAHIGPVPVEELLALAPAFAGAGLALRARLMDVHPRHRGRD